MWRWKPPLSGDFNVPTPVAVDGKLLVATENNGTRFYEFDAAGRINPRPVAANDQRAPKTSSPVVVGQRVFCVSGEMYCLDLAHDLRPVWIGDDKALGEYSSLMASENRVLAIGRGGELLLVDATSDKFHII